MFLLIKPIVFWRSRCRRRRRILRSLMTLVDAPTLIVNWRENLALRRDVSQQASVYSLLATNLAQLFWMMIGKALS